MACKMRKPCIPVRNQLKKMNDLTALDPDTATHADFRRVACLAKILVWETDANDICTYLNPEAAALLGDVTRLSFSTWSKFIHPDDLARILPIFAKAKKNKATFQFEYRIVVNDGSVRWMLSTGGPRFSGDGEFLGYTGTTIDATEWHEATQRISKTEARLQLFTKYSSEAVFCCAVDGTVYDASPSITRLLGYETSEVLGKSFYDLMHPDDADVVKDEALYCSQNQAVIDGIDCRVSHKNGPFLWFSVQIQSQIDFVTKEHLGTVAVLRDISFERALSQELRRRKERYRSMMRLFADWYWETDENGCFTFVSDDLQERLGLEPQDFLGKTRVDLAMHSKQPGLREYLEKFSRREIFKDIRYAADCEGIGRWRFVSISGEPVFEKGVFKGYRGVSRDVTRKMELKENLEARG
jgi:PAS domain S-box-containing protein